MPSSITSPLNNEKHPIYHSAKIFPDDRIPIPCRTSETRRWLGLPQPTVGRVDVVSLCVVYWITLVSEAARGLIMPSSWPYFHSVGGSKEMLGVFVGVLSFGRMIVTMPLGYLSDKYSSAQIFYVSAVIQIFGHIMYAAWPTAEALIFSRLIVGLGSSTLSVCRAYVSKSIPREERTHHFAYLSALQFIGFAVLPGVGSLLTYLPKISILGIQMNGFTYPALVLVLCCVLIIVSTFLFYEDPQSPAPSRTTTTPLVTIGAGNLVKSENPDYLALSVCVLANMVFRGLVAELETVTTPFLMEQYGMSFSTSGTYLTIFGFFGLFIYSIFKYISRIFSDRWLIYIGLIVTAISTVPLMFQFISVNLPVIVYVSFIGALWSVAYPIGQTGSLSLFSKVMRGLPPGGLLGIFSATGSGARIGFAVAAGALWGYFGREAVFASMVACCFACIALVWISWRRLRT